MKTRSFVLTLSLVFSLTLALIVLVAGSGQSTVQADPRIDARVLFDIDQSGQADVLIILGDAPDLTPAYNLQTKEARGQWVYDTLRVHAQTSQTDLVAALDRAGVPYQQFWAANAVRTTIDADTLDRVLALSSVQRVRANVAQIGVDPRPAEELTASSVLTSPWGINRVEAPWAWEQDITGEGIVVGGQDTGYDWDHVALKQTYRGYDAETDTVDHNYSWHDAIHEAIKSGSNPCGFDSAVPCDDHGHGTHTMGTIAGNDLASTDPAWPAGATNAIGVAPGPNGSAAATWTGAMVAPPPTSNASNGLWRLILMAAIRSSMATRSQAPDVINNSWSCPPEEECTNDQNDIIEPALNAADAAGIVVVTSAGNDGPTIADR